MSNCEFCHKFLSKEKGEEDHGCLDCHGYIYIVNGVNVCFHCIEKENRKLRDENYKLRDCLKFYADEANQIAPIYKHDGRNRPGADFTQPYRMDSGKRAREALKELEEK